MKTPSQASNLINFIFESFDNVGLCGQLIRWIVISYHNVIFSPFYLPNPITQTEIERIATLGLPGLAPGGKSEDFSLALFGAIGETLERVLAILYNRRLELHGFETGDLLFGAYRELSKNYNLIGPGEIQFFHERQFEDPYVPFEPFTEETRITWVRGYRLFSKEETYFPAQYACLGHQTKPHERPIAYSTSAGLAAGSDFDQVLYKGIMETIERDIVLLHWVSKTPPVALNAPRDFLLDLLGEIEYVVNNRDIILKLYYFASDIPGVHVVLAALISKKFRYFKYVSGLGADLSIADAIKGALLEAFQAQNLIYFIHGSLKTYGKHSTYYYVEKEASNKRVMSIFQSMFYWGYPENLSNLLSTFLTDHKSVTIEELEEKSVIGRAGIKFKLSKLLDILRAKNIDPIIIDQTPREVSKGVCVKRVIIPELVFYYVPSVPFFGHKRYSMAPKILKNEERRLSFDEYNPLPFPFP